MPIRRNLFVLLAVMALPISMAAQLPQLPPVTFLSGTDSLEATSGKALAMLRDYLTDKTYVSTLRIEGHTGAGGNAASSQQLSEKRAMAVARWLVGAGMDCKRLIAVGFGDTKPVAAADAPDHAARNERVEFVNAALRGHAIGGLPLDGGGRPAGDPCAR